MSLYEKLIIAGICLVVAGAIWHSIGKQNTKPGRPTGGNNPPRETPDDQK